MHETPLTIMLVEDNPGDARLLEESLTEDAGDAFRLLWIQDLASALERLADEVIDAVILDLNLPDSNGFETFTRMRSAAADLPILVLTGLEDDQLGLKAIQQGAQDYLSKSDVTGSKIARSLRYAIERHRSQVREASRMRSIPRGKVVGVVGVKGGVGTTTVTLNVAALLARNTRRSVTAAELRSDFGSFAALLQEAPAHSLATLAGFDLSAVSDSVLDKCVSRSRFDFDVLFSPQEPEDFVPLPDEKARQLVDRLARRSAYTFLDLPGIAHPITEAVLNSCSFLMLVTERDPCSVAAARSALHFLAERRPDHPEFGLVVVNRSLMIDGLSPRQIEAMLNCPLLGVVPPAPEISVSAQRSGAPLAIHRPLSAPATMLTSITEKVARAISEPALKKAEIESIPA